MRDIFESVHQPAGLLHKTNDSLFTGDSTSSNGKERSLNCKVIRDGTNGFPAWFEVFQEKLLVHGHSSSVFTLQIPDSDTFALSAFKGDFRVNYGIRSSSKPLAAVSGSRNTQLLTRECEKCLTAGPQWFLKCDELAGAGEDVYNVLVRQLKGWKKYIIKSVGNMCLKKSVPKMSLKVHCFLALY